MAIGARELGRSRFTTWTVSIAIGERAGRTHATAELQTDSETTLSGAGTVYLSPSHDAGSQVGDELAVARALFDLAQSLVQRATVDVAESVRGRKGCEQLR
jgi:hypothetical protein